jgi:hypothetical protein
MRRRLATLLIVASIVAPATAQDLDFSKIKCKDFMGAPKDEVGSVLTWLEGFYAERNAPPIMYQDKTMKDLKDLASYCDSHSDDDVMKAAAAVMSVK